MRDKPMRQYLSQNIRPADIWLPAALFLLPVLMAIWPLIVEVPPRRGLVYTPTIVQFFEVAIIIYGISARQYRVPGLKWPVHMTVCAAVLAGIVIYSTLFRALHLSYSAEKVLDMVLFLFVCYFGASIFRRSGPALMRLCLVAIFAGILASVPVIAILFHYKLPAYMLWPDYLPGYVYVRIYGFALTVAIAIGIGLLALPEAQKKIMRWAVLGGLITLWTTLFWTSSRGGIFSLFIILPVTAILVPAARKAILFSLIAIPIGGFLSAFIPAESAAYGFFNAITDTFFPDKDAVGRLVHWQLMLGFVNEQPWLGHGFAQTILIVGEVMKPYAHTHNIVLEAAMSWGWPGAVIAAYLTTIFLFQALRTTRDGTEAENIPALLLVFVLLPYAFVDGVFFYYHSLLPLGICCAMLLANRSQKPKD